MKGNSDCHIPNDAYREGWDRIFGRETNYPAEAMVLTREEYEEKYPERRMLGIKKSKPVNFDTSSKNIQ